MHLYFKITAIAVLLFMQQTRAQILPGGSSSSSSTSSTPASYPVYLGITDPSIVSSVTAQGKPVFSVPAINTLVNQYTVTSFEQPYSTSRLLVMRQTYKMEVSSTALPVVLVSNYPQYFSGWSLLPQLKNGMFYTPNDFPNVTGKRNTGYLDSIGAPKAWDYSKGSSNIVIGMHDIDLDTLHHDLASKLVSHQNTSYLWSIAGGHGTRIAGLIAAETHNNPGVPPGLPPYYGYYPSIGFNCKLDYVGCTGLIGGTIEANCPGFLQTSQRGRRVMNLSGGNWGGDTLFKLVDSTGLWSFLNMEMMYQEIYENGTFFVAAAGNGYSDTSIWHSSWYNYPASLDYVFSVSGVGWKNPYLGGIHTNVSGLHEWLRSDSMTTQTHNSRVDLLAPSFEIGGLKWYGDYDDGTGYKGTSLAAPLVSGTAGLILSLDSCYTPYQLEYILKKSANSSILNLSQNLKYAGRLGAGRLDAGNAVEQVFTANNPDDPTNEYNCNYSGTQTLFIEGVEFNTLCVPGRSSNGVKPKLTPIIRNGTPPYIARWEPMKFPDNAAYLNDYNTFSPVIDSATEMVVNGNPMGSLFHYRLTVYDNSPVPKVASRIIYIDLTSGEQEYSWRPYLVGRDAYMDMVWDENDMDVKDARDNNYYMSPDLWNRQTAAYNPEHQNAEYKQTDSNYAFVRVRNVGCKQYDPGTYPHYVKLYWTVASTGEDWKNDWDGTGPPVLGKPCGGALTTGYGIPIQKLDPGDTMIIRRGWRPVKPQDYQTNDLNVCLLARIVDAGDNAGGEVAGPVITNVRQLRRVFTRNLWVGDIYPYNKSAKTRFLVANADAVAQTFDVQFINDKAIHRHFAGNFSAIGYVTLYLGELYDVWMNAGGDGTYLSRDAEKKTVTIDGSQTLELLHIPLGAHVKYPVDIEFTILPGATIPEYRYDFHLRQFKVLDGHRSDDIYGSMSFQINTHAESVSRQANSNEQEDALMSPGSGFAIYPNPVKTNLTLTYLSEEEQVVDLNMYDVTGRKMLGKEDQYFRNSRADIDVSGFVPGVYFLTVTNGRGVNERFKFVKE